jgi:hypothetical protein
MGGFVTIKKLPRQRTLTREIGSYSIWRSIANITANFTSNCRSVALTFTTSFTSHHLLSLKPDSGLTKPPSGFGFKAMPPRKKVLSVYTRAI